MQNKDPRRRGLLHKRFFDRVTGFPISGPGHISKFEHWEFPKMQIFSKKGRIKGEKDIAGCITLEIGTPSIFDSFIFWRKIIPALNPRDEFRTRKPEKRPFLTTILIPFYDLQNKINPKGD